MSFDGDGSPLPDDITESSFPPYDLSKVANPPSIARLYGYNIESLQSLINHRLIFTSRHLHRPLTASETDALVFWTARNYTISSYGPLLGLTGGIAHAMRTREGMRFPFFKPGGELLAGMKAGRVFLWEMGRSGVLGWHLARGVAYGFLGSWLGRFLVTGYAVGLTVAGEGGDDRLKGVREGLGMGRRRAGAGARGGTSSNSTGYTEAAHIQDWQQQQQRRPAPPWLPSPSPQKQPPPSDPYPTQQTDLDSGDRLLSDDEMRLEEETRHQRAPPSAANRTPFSGERTNNTSTPQTPTTTTWSRIRASAISSPSPAKTPTSAWQRARESHHSDEDGGFGEEEAGRRSREEAQREFDETVERERSVAAGEDEGGWT